MFYFLQITINGMSEELKQLGFKQTLKKFLKTNFSKKNNIWRSIWFIIAVAIVLIPGIPLNLWAAKQNYGHYGSYNGFIDIYVTRNLGNGFSSGSEWPQGVVYFLKIFMSFIILLLAAFLPCKWYYTLPLCASFVGGMFNVFDKAAHNDAVIDYFALFPKSPDDVGWFIFNVPDFYITGGIIFACVAYVVSYIIQIVRNKKNKKTDTTSSINKS